MVQIGKDTFFRSYTSHHHGLQSITTRFIAKRVDKKKIYVQNCPLVTCLICVKLFIGLWRCDCAVRFAKCEHRGAGGWSLEYCWPYQPCCHVKSSALF